jgi:hypothetical protein
MCYLNDSWLGNEYADYLYIKCIFISFLWVFFSKINQCVLALYAITNF